MNILLKLSALILPVLLLNSYKSNAQNTDLPKMDLHVHLNYAGQSLGNTAEAYEKASELSKKMGVTFGIAEEFGNDNIRVNDSLVLNSVALARKTGNGRIRHYFHILFYGNFCADHFTLSL